ERSNAPFFFKRYFETASIALTCLPLSAISLRTDHVWAFRNILPSSFSLLPIFSPLSFVALKNHSPSHAYFSNACFNSPALVEYLLYNFSSPVFLHTEENFCRIK